MATPIAFFCGTIHVLSWSFPEFVIYTGIDRDHFGVKLGIVSM